jgi:transposase
VSNWYWIVDEIEAAGCVPKLVHAHKAKLMMGMINKTDKLDARGLNRLQRAGTLPEVWIPRGELRDQRELPRTRMVFVQQRTRLKNRIHATVTKFGLTPPAVSDLFGQGGRLWLRQQLGGLPPQTAYTLAGLLEALEALSQQIARLERRMREVFHGTPAIDLLMTLPGVGFILAVVIAAEIGDVGRFEGAEYLASYAGTTPRVHASGGKTRYGPLRPDVNRYLKWAFVEAANVTCRVRRRHPHRHVSRLYERLARPKGHQKAVGAVARHLAEATYWVLTKQESYRDPHQQGQLDSSTGA